MTIVNIEDIAPLWPGGTIPDPDRAKALLGLAELRIAARVPNLQARIDSGQLDKGLLELAVYNVISRTLNAPDDGAKQGSETYGPFSRSRTFDTDPMRITDADLADLMPASSASVGSWGYVGVGLRPYQVPDRQVRDVDSGAWTW